MAQLAQVGTLRGIAPALGPELLPGHDGELFDLLRPSEVLLEAVEALLFHLDDALLHLVLGEDDAVVDEAEEGAERDQPLGRVVLVEPDGVAKVLGKLVVEIVVALAQGQQRRDERVPRRVLVGEGGGAKGVREGVDEEGGVVHEDQAGHTGNEVAAPIVAPTEAGNQHREDERHEGSEPVIVAVLPADHRVGVQVGNVGFADLGRVLLEEHPAQVGVEEALLGIVRVPLGIGIPVVRTMVTAPPADRSLEGTRSTEEQSELHRKPGLVSLVGPEAVISGGDAKAGDKIVNYSPNEGLDVEVPVVDAVNGEKRGSDQKGSVQPVQSRIQRSFSLRLGHLFERAIVDSLVVNVALGGDIAEELPREAAFVQVLAPVLLQSSPRHTQIVVRDRSRDVMRNVDVNVVAQKLNPSRIVAVNC
mmetsp:Transcript_26683/g.45979  ORF Transcript_26683/g.45979 Transcript_26683/m.45979 type:complete len:418 (+) Transcript_26683:623-1876(+)